MAMARSAPTRAGIPRLGVSNLPCLVATPSLVTSRPSTSCSAVNSDGPTATQALKAVLSRKDVLAGTFLAAAPALISLSSATKASADDDDDARKAAAAKALVKQFYEDCKTGNYDAAFSVFSDKAKIKSNFNGKTYTGKGKEGIKQLFEIIDANVEVKSFDVKKVFVDDDGDEAIAFVETTLRNKASGVTVEDVSLVNVFIFDAQGKIFKFTEYTDTLLVSKVIQW